MNTQRDPDEMRDKLDELGDDIERARANVNDPADKVEDEQLYVESGELEPVDDAITPPG